MTTASNQACLKAAGALYNLLADDNVYKLLDEQERDKVRNVIAITNKIERATRR